MENCACSRATSQYGVWVVWGGAISFKLLVDSSDATLHHGLGFCVGWRGAITFKFCAHLTDAKLRHGLGFCLGWGGAIKFNLLAHSTDTMLQLRKKESKGLVSSVWTTRKNRAINFHLLQGNRIWQWTWHLGNSKGYIHESYRSRPKKALGRLKRLWQK